MSVSHPPVEKRIDLGLVRLTSKSTIQQVGNDDDIYRIDIRETGFFKLKFNDTEVQEAIKTRCNGGSASRDIYANQANGNLGDIWLLVVCVDPVSGNEIVVKNKVKGNSPS